MRTTGWWARSGFRAGSAFLAARSASHFRPLTGQDGWRRLNVAITRARYRTGILTSIRPSDIPDSVTNTALMHLRRYLTHAAQGMAGF